jgi:hypothetical protein
MHHGIVTTPPLVLLCVLSCSAMCEHVMICVDMCFYVRLRVTMS